MGFSSRSGFWNDVETRFRPDGCGWRRTRRSKNHETKPSRDSERRSSRFVLFLERRPSVPLGVCAVYATFASLDVARPESRGSGGRLGIGSRRFRGFAAAVWALVLTPSRAKTHCFAIVVPRGEATRGEVVSLWKSALSPRPAPLHSSVSFSSFGRPMRIVPESVQPVARRKRDAAITPLDTG